MSIIFLTVHKAASRFMGSVVLPELAADLGWTHLNPFAENFRLGADPAEIRVDDFSGARDAVLGPVRRPGQIKDPAAFQGWSEILLLRDPRDVLVSLYFSMAQSHGAPGGPLATRFAAARQEALTWDIDRFVLEKAPKFQARYLDYARRFGARPGLTLLRYEDMVADWPSFVDALMAALDPSPSPQWRASMLGHASSFLPRQENPAAHIRQVTPGDHVRKLKPETIAILDQVFAEPLDWLGLKPSSAA